MSNHPERTTLSGRLPEQLDGGAPAGVDPQTGMNKDYWVLSAAERAKGFVRPVRRTYIHKACGVPTTMHITIAETFARDPTFYGAGFCAHCRQHFPNKDLVWEDGSPVGS